MPVLCTDIPRNEKGDGGFVRGDHWSMKTHFDPMRHHRRSIRLKGYDYTAVGIYYVIICSYRYQYLFSEVADNKMSLNDTGTIAEACWLAMPEHFPGVSLDEWIIMPNHIHGIIVINEEESVRATHASPVHIQSSSPMPAGPKRRSVGAIVGSFKLDAAKLINEQRGTPGATVWQRNYYEHIVRDEADLVRIQLYITANPACWVQEAELIPFPMEKIRTRSGI
jgi:putative transposase